MIRETFICRECSAKCEVKMGCEVENDFPKPCLSECFIPIWKKRIKK